MMEKAKPDYFQKTVEVLTAQHALHKGIGTAQDYIDTVNRVVNEIGAGAIIGLLAKFALTSLYELEDGDVEAVDHRLQLVALAAAQLVEVEKTTPQIENES